MTAPRHGYLWALVAVLGIACLAAYWPRGADPAVTAAIAWKRDTLPKILKQVSRDSAASADSLRIANNRATMARHALGGASASLLALKRQQAAQLDSEKTASDSLLRLTAQRDSADSAYAREASAYQTLLGAYGLERARGDSLAKALAAGVGHLQQVIQVKTRRCGLGAGLGIAVGTSRLTPGILVGGFCRL